MANNITVNTATLRSKASALRQANTNFKRQIDSLSTQENSLNGMWDGDANDTFHKAFISDITQMKKFYNAIILFINSLEEIAKQYDTTEQKNRSIAEARKYK